MYSKNRASYIHYPILYTQHADTYTIFYFLYFLYIKKNIKVVPYTLHTQHADTYTTLYIVRQERE